MKGTLAARPFALRIGSKRGWLPGKVAGWSLEEIETQSQHRQFTKSF
jgi:hypothetical protein